MLIKAQSPESQAKVSFTINQAAQRPAAGLVYPQPAKIPEIVGTWKYGRVTVEPPEATLPIADLSAAEIHPIALVRGP